MHTQLPVSRRVVLKSSVFGMLVACIPNLVYSSEAVGFANELGEKPKLPSRYPSIDDDLVAETVGVSHFNLDRLKELVGTRPELSRATWDWAFGDWETALGAASHVGRRDIALYLLSAGARPDIFCFAMLGAYSAVKSMIDAQPGIQTIAGPHGISLLQHAKNGLLSEDLNEHQKTESSKLVSYLEGLGDSDVATNYLPIEEAEKNKYVGDYMYGDGPADGFSIKMNMRKLISLGKLGKFGGALYQKSKDVFIYNGTSSVEISFAFENDRVVSLTVREPGLVLTARKV